VLVASREGSKASTSEIKASTSEASTQGGQGRHLMSSGYLGNSVSSVIGVCSAAPHDMSLPDLLRAWKLVRASLSDLLISLPASLPTCLAASLLLDSTTSPCLSIPPCLSGSLHHHVWCLAWHGVARACKLL